MSIETQTTITYAEFKAWMEGMIRGKRGALPDLEDWKNIKMMMDKVVPDKPIRVPPIGSPTPVPSAPYWPTLPAIPSHPWQPTLPNTPWPRRETDPCTSPTPHLPWITYTTDNTLPCGSDTRSPWNNQSGMVHPDISPSWDISGMTGMDHTGSSYIVSSPAKFTSMACSVISDNPDVKDWTTGCL